MRLTARNIVKALVLIAVLLFFLPFLLKFDNDDTSKHKSQVDEHANVKREAVDLQNLDKPAEATKKSAVMQKGVLGNFEPPEPRYAKRPGDNGLPVETLVNEQQEANRQISEYGFNMVASGKIPMNRTIPDTRMSECKYWQYPTNQPTASVILVFHNEGFSTLMRTVHSVIDASPPRLLHEVVLVDDYSDKEALKAPLDEYVAAHFPAKLVRLYRNDKREGLIRTRTKGAELATGDVIVFLDAHCECNRNWLVPLLDPIRLDRSTMAVPIVDGIDWNDFSYRSVYGAPDAHHRGIFEWGFLYKENLVPKKELDRRQHNSEPYRSPTHAGGLFAMDRQYFFELGGYDPGLQIWGGENFELSFKLWQCGGNIVWVPCSHVGHIYRHHMPYGFGNIDSKIPIIQLNYLRVVSVWLDPEFQDYFYRREPYIRGYPAGDVSAQLRLKSDKKCKSFKWFMDNVAYDVYERYPPPSANKVWGEFKNRDTGRCIDADSQSPGAGVHTGFCHHWGGNQLLRLNEEGQWGVGERCLLIRGEELQVQWCATEPTGPWEYISETGLIRDRERNLCVQDTGSKLRLVACDGSATNQQWSVAELYAKSRL